MAERCRDEARDDFERLEVGVVEAAGLARRDPEDGGNRAAGAERCGCDRENSAAGGKRTEAGVDTRVVAQRSLLVPERPAGERVREGRALADLVRHEARPGAVHELVAFDEHDRRALRVRQFLRALADELHRSLEGSRARDLALRLEDAVQLLGSLVACQFGGSVGRVPGAEKMTDPLHLLGSRPVSRVP